MKKLMTLASIFIVILNQSANAWSAAKNCRIFCMKSIMSFFVLLMSITTFASSEVEKNNLVQACGDRNGSSYTYEFRVENSTLYQKSSSYGETFEHEPLSIQQTQALNNAQLATVSQSLGFTTGHLKSGISYTYKDPSDERLAPDNYTIQIIATDVNGEVYLISQFGSFYLGYNYVILEKSSTCS